MQQQAKKLEVRRRQETVVLVWALILKKRKDSNNMVLLVQMERLPELPKQQCKRSSDSRRRILMKLFSRGMSTLR